MYRQRNLALETTSRSGPPARHDGRHYIQWNAYSQGFSSQSQRLRTPTRSPTTSRSRDVLAGEVRRRRNDSNAEHQFVRRAKARPLRIRCWEKVIFLFSFTFFSCPSKSFPRVEIQKEKSSQCKLTKNRRENRICPGYNVAERSLAVAIMRILWAFEVTPSPDAKLPLNIADWRGDFPGLAGPTMPVMMLPRSKERVAVIDEAFAAAKMEREAIVS